jgi:thiamine kinase-like enzyme
VSELERAVERVWPAQGARVEVLGGGITNHNVKVTLDDEVLVLRVAGQGTELLGIDRRVEREATVAAASVGVGPEVVEFIEPEGWLVTRFIAGTTPPVERMRERPMLHRVADALRAIHSGPPISAVFDSFRVVERYLALARERGAAVPAGYERAHGLAVQIEAARAAAPRCFCHNDLLNANFIDDAERLRIVDWEYAGMGDPFFDLANFAVNHELDREQRRTLLAAYAGTVLDEEVRALELMRFMSDFREAMWGVLQAAVSTLEFDFGAYAREHFERLERTAEEPAFREAFGAGRA